MQENDEILENSHDFNLNLSEKSHEDPTNKIYDNENYFSSDQKHILKLNSFFEINSQKSLQDDHSLQKQFVQCENYFQSDDNQFYYKDNSCEKDQPVKQVNKEHQVIPQIQVKKPGETKNLSKCLARQLQKFIVNTIRHSDDPQLKKKLENPELKVFLKENPEYINKQTLTEFISTSIGQVFCKEFFGNCKWSCNLIKQSKIDIELCFRHNLSYYLEVIKKKKKLNQN